MTKPIKTHNQNIEAYELMPTDDESVKLLDRRASIFSEPEKRVDAREKIPYIKFKLGNSKDQYGISYAFVKEIIKRTIITPVPFAPEFVSGLINWQGILLTVINLKRFFGIRSSAKESCGYIIIIHFKESFIGLEVNEIVGNDHYDVESIEEALPNSVIQKEYILGLHQGIIAVVNAEVVMNKLRERLTT